MAEKYLYIASSWRNKSYPLVVKMSRGAAVSANEDLDEPDFGVYDFRHPAGGTGFNWRDLDPDWENWSMTQYRKNLRHPIAEKGWASDIGALERATACLLVGPAGRSAHLELGYVAGKGLPCAIYLSESQEPELMYRMADILLDATEVVEWVMKVMTA